MARVTVEDCVDKVTNRFELILLASHRSRMISAGSGLTLERDNDKNPVVALREIADVEPALKETFLACESDLKPAVLVYGLAILILNWLI